MPASTIKQADSTTAKWAMREVHKIRLSVYGNEASPEVLNQCPVYKESEKLRVENLGWWRGRSKKLRLWVFGSIVWSILVCLFVLVFDPFDKGRYGHMDDEEWLQMLFVIAIPLFAGGVVHRYEKYVR